MVVGALPAMVEPEHSLHMARVVMVAVTSITSEPRAARDEREHHSIRLPGFVESKKGKERECVCVSG
jgi:hypothetical protein